MAGKATSRARIKAGTHERMEQSVLQKQSVGEHKRGIPKEPRLFMREMQEAGTDNACKDCAPQDIPDTLEYNKP